MVDDELLNTSPTDLAALASGVDDIDSVVAFCDARHTPEVLRVGRVLRDAAVGR
jgi:hypothetical protein